MAQEFAVNMLEMLSLEKQAHYQKSIPQKNNVNPEFEIIDKKIDVFSGCLITFQLKNPSDPIYFAKNDFVKLQKVEECKVCDTLMDMSILTLENASEDKEKEQEQSMCVVEEISQKTVRIGFKPPVAGMNLPHDITFKIIPYISNIVFDRMDKAMQTLKNYKRDPSHQLIELFFHEQSYDKQGVVQEKDPIDLDIDRIQLIQSYSPICSEDEEYSPKSPPRIASLKEKPIVFYNPKLNDCQQKAVKLALDEPEVAIIHGPPGTGKTTTVVEILLQLVKKNLKILVCAPSNAAVDNLVTKLMEAKEKYELEVNNKWMVRYGHISRVKTECFQHSTSEVIKRHRTYGDIQLAENKMNQALRRKNNKLAEYCWAKITGLSRSAIKESFISTQIVLTTLTSVSEESDIFNCVEFDLAVIDECSQGLEASAWLVLLKVKKCILAGDYQQLPPTVISQEIDVVKCLKLSLMERLLEILGSDKVIMLTCQYRMHKLIQEWSSKKFYEGKLQPHHSVKSHLLSDFKGVKEDIDGITSSPLLLIDTAEMPKKTESSKNQTQLYNELEASLVCSHVYKLIRLGVKPQYISIISPYNLQVKVLKIMLKSVPKVEVSSIDSFQGRENEVIIISLVRSNNTNSIGFLKDLKRMNVAVTRAKRHLAVVCDTKTVKGTDIAENMKKVALIIPAEKCTLLNFSFENNEEMKSLLQDNSPINKPGFRKPIKSKAFNKVKESRVIKDSGNDASIIPLHLVHHVTRNKHRTPNGTKKNDFHHKKNRRSRNKKQRNQTVLKLLESNCQKVESEEKMKIIKNNNQTMNKYDQTGDIPTSFIISKPLTPIKLKMPSFVGKEEKDLKQRDYFLNYESIGINDRNKTLEMGSNTIESMDKNNPIKIKTICTSRVDHSVVKAHTSQSFAYSFRLPPARPKSIIESGEHFSNGKKDSQNTIGFMAIKTPIEVKNKHYRVVSDHPLVKAHTSLGDGVSVRLSRPPPLKNRCSLMAKFQSQEITSPRVTTYVDSIPAQPSVSNPRRSSEGKEKIKEKIKKNVKNKCILI